MVITFIDTTISITILNEINFKMWSGYSEVKVNPWKFALPLLSDLVAQLAVAPN